MKSHPLTTSSRRHAAGRIGLGMLLLLGSAVGSMPLAGAEAPDDAPGWEPEPEEPIFSAPANGFDWSVPDRFRDKGDGRFIWHWNEAEVKYDESYVNPTSFPMNISGCQTETDLSKAMAGQPTVNTYVFESADGQRIEGKDCDIQATFPEEAKYDVRWTAIRPDGSQLGSWNQTVEVKDLLIVAMGDSYGSGEGAPEYDRVSGAMYGTWVDNRCHRSSFAGAPQAARAIEMADRKTSVTFLSFACSGATINREYGGYSDKFPENKHDPWAPFDPAKNDGSGILGESRGVQPPNKDDYSDKIPAQVDQLAAALRPAGRSVEAVRDIDALVMSAGGNDASFGPLASACVIWDDCRHPDNKAFTNPNGGAKVNLDARIGHDLDTMPGRYDALASALAELKANHSIDIGGTYVTEYPDPGTEKVDGRIRECEYILDDIMVSMELQGVNPWFPPPAHGTELNFARKVFLPTLNNKLHEAAGRHGWNYVDGVSDGFLGHGYCLGDFRFANKDRYVQTAVMSTWQQGPYHLLGEQSTKGLLHPTREGYQVYKNRIVAHAKPQLALRGPDGGEHFEFADTTPPTRPVLDFGGIELDGWSDGPVTITATSTDDAAAGIARLEYRIGDGAWTTMVDGTVEITAEGLSMLSFRAFDAAGNVSEVVTVPISIDTLGPVVECGAADGEWHADDVSIGCTATDASSGIAEADEAFELPTSVSLGVETDDAVTAGRAVCDAAGNCTTVAGIGGNHVDRKVPNVTVELPAGPFTLGEQVAVTYECTDGGSGIDTCAAPVASGGFLDTTKVGTQSFRVVATDAVGNTSSRTVSYDVRYDFGGLTGPVDAPPAVNVVNGGSAVPVKFSLDGDHGLGIIAAGSPTSKQVSCNSSMPADAVEQTVSTTGPALSYDAASDTYSLRWKTEKAWNGTCRQLSIKLADGSVHHANFRFGK